MKPAVETFSDSLDLNRKAATNATSTNGTSPANGSATPDEPIDTVDPVAQRAARKRKLIVWAARIAVLVAFLGSWQLGTHTQHIDKFFWGSPSGVWTQLVYWVRHGTAQGPLWEQLAVTMREAGWGFLIGVVLGVIFGISLGRNRLLADVVGPYIKMLNAIPRVVLGSLFIVGLGLGERSKVATAVVLVFFGVFFNAFQGAREVDRNLISNARILGASKGQVTRGLVIPSAMTWIIASLHSAFGYALIGAVVGEVLGASKGLGLLIRTSQGLFNMDGVIAGMFILAVVALIAEFLITKVEKRVLRWRPPVQSALEV